MLLQLIMQTLFLKTVSRNDKEHVKVDQHTSMEATQENPSSLSWLSFLLQSYMWQLIMQIFY